MNKQIKKRTKKGFTLIELVVVIAILGILAAILIPVIGGFINRATESANAANARSLYGAVAMALTDPNHNIPLTDGSGTRADNDDTALPSSVALMFGNLPDGDTAGWTITNNVIERASYNGVEYEGPEAPVETTAAGGGG